MAAVLIFPARPDAKVVSLAGAGAAENVLPRDHFGKRKLDASFSKLGALGQGVAAALDLARDADTRQRNIQRAGQAARDAADRKRIPADEVIAASEAADALYQQMFKFARVSGNAGFLVLARDFENASERLAMLAAQIGEPR